MFTHSVYFWLRDDLASDQLAKFRDGLKSLTTIPTVKVAHIGAPAATDRPIIDRSYTAALVLMFDNQADQDVYQAHDVHEAFRQACDGYWNKIVIYDSVS